VDLWLVAIDGSADSEIPPVDILSELERNRANNYRREKDRVRFILAHAALRRILGSYVGRSPRDLTIATTKHGKPMLVRDDGGPDIRFNLSHSDALAAITVTVGRETGVDVESLQRQADFENIARHYFSPAERLALDGAPDLKKHLFFLRYWTRKEAVLKAVGMGLIDGLEHIDTFAEDCDRLMQVSLQIDSRMHRLAVKSFVHGNCIGALAWLLAADDTDYADSIRVIRG
jgi:4'-phosphopantetheinyl transferase